MLHKKRTRETANAACANVTKEMAKPRMTKSARIAERTLDTAELQNCPVPPCPEPSTKSSRREPGQPEKAQISVDNDDRRYRDLRIENMLTDEHSNDVKLKKSAHVEVTVTASHRFSAAKIDKDTKMIRCDTASLSFARPSS